MIKDYFVNGYSYIIVPESVRNVPIELAKMYQDPIDGKDGFYHSIDTLSESLGSLFVPTPILGGKFLLIHYGFDEEEDTDERVLFKKFMTDKGLVNMRVGVKLDSIDFTALHGNEFGVFSAREIKKFMGKVNDGRF